MISHKLRSKREGVVYWGQKKWIFPGSTHSEHLHISSRLRHTGPFSFHVSLFVCLFFFFLSFLWSIVYVQVNSKRYFFLFPSYTNNTYTCTRSKGISIAFFVRSLLKKTNMSFTRHKVFLVLTHPPSLPMGSL